MEIYCLAFGGHSCSCIDGSWYTHSVAPIEWRGRVLKCFCWFPRSRARCFLAVVIQFVAFPVRLDGGAAQQRGTVRRRTLDDGAVRLVTPSRQTITCYDPHHLREILQFSFAIVLALRVKKVESVRMHVLVRCPTKKYWFYTNISFF